MGWTAPEVSNIHSNELKIKLQFLAFLWFSLKMFTMERLIIDEVSKCLLDRVGLSKTTNPKFTHM